MPAKTIKDSEPGVMKALWKSSPLTLAQIRECLTGPTGWSPSTIKTLVFRLRDSSMRKGTVSNEGVNDNRHACQSD